MIADVVQIKSVLRRMRGGSQSHLVEGEDGQFYVAKFLGNPQGNRTLINEWIGDRLLRKLGVCTPEICILELSETTQAALEDRLYFSLGERKVAVQPGLHLGSRCPVDPGKKAIFDVLPRKMLQYVVNLEDFAKAFVVDHIVGHADCRQAIFVREPGPQLKLRAYLIDHGMIFGGREWVIRDLSTHGLYVDPMIYSMVDMHNLCEKALDLLTICTEDDLEAIVRVLPTDWFSPGDTEDLSDLYLHLHAVRARHYALIMRHLEMLPHAFKCKPEKSADFQPINDLVYPMIAATQVAMC